MLTLVFFSATLLPRAAPIGERPSGPAGGRGRGRGRGDRTFASREFEGEVVGSEGGRGYNSRGGRGDRGGQGRGRGGRGERTDGEEGPRRPRREYDRRDGTGRA